MKRAISIDQLQKNLGDGQALLELVDLYLDFLLQRPLDQILVPGELAQVITSTVRSLAADPANEDWFKKQIESVLAEARQVKIEGSLKSHLPKASWEAASHIAAMPMIIRHEFGAQVLNHRFVRTFLREVLTKSILEFSQVVAKNLPGGKMVSGLLGRAMNMASGLEGVTGPLEQKAKEFVEDALGPSVEIGAGLVASADHANDLADWRRHIFAVLGEQSAQDFLEAFQDIEGPELAGEVADLIRGIATWDKLEKNLASVFRQALEEVGEKSVAEWIADTTLDSELRSLVKSQFNILGSPFIQSNEFCDWLERWGNETGK